MTFYDELIRFSSDTNTLAVQTRFSRGVSRMDKKFTMLVPSNEAWQKIRLSHVTSHKSLFDGRASHPVRQRCKSGTRSAFMSVWTSFIENPQSRLASSNERH